MHQRQKYAAELASSTGASAASPVPTPDVAPTFAPGKKGPAGLAPRTNYSRVNTGDIPAPDAGAAAQKALPPRGAEMLPKLAGGERLMATKMAGTPTLQNLVKTAMVNASHRVRVSEEARVQAEKMGEKTASSGVKDVIEPTSKTAAAQQVEKLASALDFIADEFDKEASLGGAYHLSGSTAAAAPPPGVSAATASTPLPDKKGEGVHTVPMHPGTQKGLPAEQGATQMQNTLDHAPGGKEKMVQKNAGADVASIVKAKLAQQKTAGDDAEKKETEGLEAAKKGVEKAEEAHKSEPENKDDDDKKASALVDYMLSKTKKAEDAINPAQISAGAAVPPEASASGQPGGQPAGGAPQGPTGLIGSNESATNYTRGQAYGNRKEDLKKYFDEPAMSAAHDSVLQDAFQHTGAAGPKIASAQPDAPSPVAGSVKTAAARALLTSLAKSAEAEAKKNDTAAASA